MANIKSQSQSQSQTTITIKVNLRCCEECVQRMKRLLRKIKGVESSSIDVKNGVLIVSGHFDHPNKIVDKIRRKGKCVTFFSIQVDDQPEITTTCSTSPQPNGEKDLGENSKGCRHMQQPGADGKNHKCELHGVQSKVPVGRANFGQNSDDSEHSCGAHGCESGRFCAKDGDHYRCTEEGAESDQHHYGCGSGERHYPCSWSFSEPHFDAPHNFNANQGFDSMHYSYRHYPEMMPHFHGQIPQQFQNDPMDFVRHLFNDDNPPGCWIM
uniref:HMA domain-containing protein n=1 Tax=Kalanchoe fedtschenkoi TaxID=63787 RepID=A0A7N0V7Y9_KALFE